MHQREWLASLLWEHSLIVVSSANSDTFRYSLSFPQLRLVWCNALWAMKVSWLSIPIKSRMTWRLDTGVSSSRNWWRAHQSTTRFWDEHLGLLVCQAPLQIHTQAYKLVSTSIVAWQTLPHTEHPWCVSTWWVSSRANWMTYSYFWKLIQCFFDAWCLCFYWHLILKTITEFSQLSIYIYTANTCQYILTSRFHLETL